MGGTTQLQTFSARGPIGGGTEKLPGRKEREKQYANGAALGDGILIKHAF